jgi:hypothetical protein
MKRMRCGVEADFEAIARGLYAIMDAEMLSALAFGMLPAKLMELAEREFRYRLVRSQMKAYGVEATPENIRKWGAAVKADVVSEFNHELAVAMLGQAKAAGQLVV